MDVSGRPLLDTKSDHTLFAGRERELQKLLTSVERNLNVLVTGDRGTGKTTLLRQLAYQLRERAPEQPPAYVEGHLPEDVKVFLDLVRYRLGLSPRVTNPADALATVTMFKRKVPLEDTLRLSRLVGSLAEAVREGERRVVLVDELPAESVGQTLFGRLRDELWQVPLTWVVAVSDKDSGPLLSPPADAFFDVVMGLEPLDRGAQRRLLETRAGKQGKAIAAQLDEGNPRRLLTLARDAIEGGAQPSDVQQALARRDAEVAKLGRAASMLMAELESLGPTSASDERLLSRLGWTRTRAVQVLKNLEEHGLVASSSVKGETGRPRKLYRPIDPVEEAEQIGRESR